jgi:hypothetical protein
METRTYSRTNRSIAQLVALLAFGLLLFAACTSGSAKEVEPPSTPTPEGEKFQGGGTADVAVNPLFDSMVAWEPEVVSVTDTRELRSGAFREGSFNYQCNVSESDPLQRRFDEFPAVAFQGSLLPGLFIDGDRLLAGAIQPIPLARAPLGLVISLASENPVVNVLDPSTATIQQAVAALQRDADSRLSGIDVVPADIQYVRKEAYSFEQTALELGFSLRYDGPLASAGIDTAFSTERSYERHTILVRMVQPMYTISFVDDNIVSPAQLLGAGVTPNEVTAAINAGRLRENSPAVYIKSVTYGRTMVFTMTSTTVASAQELQVAMNAAYGSIGGSAEVSEEHRSIIANSEIRMVAVGGDTGAAEAAIRTADPGEFFTGADAANAAALSFRVGTLGGDQAAVEDIVSFQQQNCSRTAFVEPKPEYSYRFVLSNVQGFGAVKLNDAEKLVVKSVVKFEPFPVTYAGSGEVTLGPAQLPEGAQRVTIHFGFPENLCLQTNINLKVYVNGVFKDERAFSGCAWEGIWEYSVDDATGELVRIR